ncbi:hypothetical protein C0Q70_00248 [Pomacea canaliculata]|uniref:Cytochrome b5 heme-binding domain-containing protein n=1 Tax=Pomacea canaliculata TaxID=400727 RepID=A0A2T7PW75_POMCA|nr:hypothetical protein C0Q70_00248 [Pomacea canaliculata]
MCKEEKGTSKLPVYGWDEIRKHADKNDRWLVVDGRIYDVTRWAKKHPGGERIIAHHCGQDATDAWVAFHNDHKAVCKYMQPLLVGLLKDEEKKESELIKDFRDLRAKTEEMGLFKASPLFFFSIMLHILALEVLAWFLIYTCGTSWITLLGASILLVTAQAQAGWSQHDYGHLSVFKSSWINHSMHIFVINFLKGASSSWWNYRHFLHHAKPNRMRKDPDIRFDHLFVLGKKQPVEELLWMVAFFVRYCVMFASFLGVGGTLAFYLWIRFLESHWFVWTTQMNHIPMDVDTDQDDDWVTGQLKATCNVDQSFFNDWFSGHLNFQIEHHLFPTMPRHNLHKAAPLVKSLCKKHGLDYQSKTLFTAFADIIGSLRKSGELWYEAYHM